MSDESVVELPAEKIGDVTWLFLQMTAAFPSEWLRRYPPKKTRVVKNAKLEWGRIISGYNREEIQTALDCAKKQSTLPPSTTDFWKLLANLRMRKKQSEQRDKYKHPPDRSLGIAGLKAAKTVLGQTAQK